MDKLKDNIHHIIAVLLIVLIVFMCIFVEKEIGGFWTGLWQGMCIVFTLLIFLLLHIINRSFWDNYIDDLLLSASDNIFWEYALGFVIGFLLYMIYSIALIRQEERQRIKEGRNLPRNLSKYFRYMLDTRRQ